MKKSIIWLSVAIAALVIVFVCVLAGSNNVTVHIATSGSSSSSSAENGSTEGGASSETPATEPAATDAPATQAPVQNTQVADTTAAAATTQASQQAPATTQAAQSGTLSKGEIVKAVSAAIAKLEGEQNFKGEKTEKTVINITSCSISAATDLLNSVCQKVAGEKTSTYDFKGGQAIGIGSDGKQLNDGNPVSVKDALPPHKANFKLSEAGVADAKAEKSGNGTVYTIVLAAETSTLDKAPQTNADALGYLNLGGFSIPTVTITQSDINYPKSVITVTVNGEGKVTEFKYEQPMDGTMAMKIAVISGSADFNGGNYETWKITY